MILSMCSAPSSESCAPTGSREPFSSRASARYRTSVTSVLLPLPETPVTATNVPSGTRRSRSRRLCSRAPRDAELLAVALAPLGGDRHRPVAAQEGAGDRARFGEDHLERAVGDDLAAVLPCPGADVDDPVGGPDRLLVVLDDEDRVAEVAQPRRASRSASRCRAGGARSTARRGCTGRPSGSSRSASRGGSAAPRRPTA